MEYRNPALAVDAAVRRGDEVLLIQRGNEPWKGAWALPGGFVDYGEDPTDAVLRELEEETGLKGEIVRLLDAKGDPNRDPRKHIVSIVYLIAADGEPVGGDDAADANSGQLIWYLMVSFPSLETIWKSYATGCPNNSTNAVLVTSTTADRPVVRVILIVSIQLVAISEKRPSKRSSSFQWKKCG